MRNKNIIMFGVISILFILTTTIWVANDNAKDEEIYERECEKLDLKIKSYGFMQNIYCYEIIENKVKYYKLIEIDDNFYLEEINH